MEVAIFNLVLAVLIYVGIFMMPKLVERFITLAIGIDAMLHPEKIKENAKRK